MISVSCHAEFLAVLGLSDLAILFGVNTVCSVAGQLIASTVLFIFNLPDDLALPGAAAGFYNLVLIYFSFGRPQAYYWILKPSWYGGSNYFDSARVLIIR